MVAPTARILAVFLGLLLIQCSLTIDEDELGGQRLLDCPDDQKECNVRGVTTCVGRDNPLYGCAGASCIPCNLPNATARCGPTGECVRVSCHSSYDDCNGVASDGCEEPLNHSVAHCGACGEPCPQLPNAEVACGSGHCYIRRCLPGYLDCNGNVTDGCEVDQSDPAHCGACGEPCGDICCYPGHCCDSVCGEFACSE